MKNFVEELTWRKMIHNMTPNSEQELKKGMATAYVGIDPTADKTQILASKSEVRRALKENSLSVNKEKISDTYQTNAGSLLNDKYILVQKGKKNYFIVVAK